MCRFCLSGQFGYGDLFEGRSQIGAALHLALAAEPSAWGRSLDLRSVIPSCGVVAFVTVDLTEMRSTILMGVV
jgi:hypothetical protein